MSKHKQPVLTQDNTTDSSVKTEESDRFHKRLSDVCLYSIGGLCAVSLFQLFDDECHGEFKKKTLEKILHDLGQPKQTNESMFEILEGEVMDTSDVFVDTLLADPVLKDNRTLLVTDLVGLAINEGCYDARMRVLIKHMAWQLRVTWDTVEDIECDLAETLEYNTYVMTEEEAQEKAKKSRNRKVKRYALIGLATVGGGALIGLTGGLAAPLVAAGAGAIIGGAGAAALGTTAGVAIIGSLFGVAGAGLTGYKMKRRVGAVEEFAFEPLTLIGSKYDSQRTVKQLHITIAVTGWLDSKNQDFRAPWSALAESREQYSLRWESKYLTQLGEAFDYILSTGVSMASMEALKYTILSGIITAIAWPAALISASGAIDNPWHVCLQRATEAGKQLAEVLLAREQGNRPVSLVGFSMGSRVIFSCLEELAKRKGSVGLVEDVILLGAPVSGDPKQWKRLNHVIAGKIVNGYSRGDWLLKFLFRTASVTLSVAGLAPVKWNNRRMHNIDLTDVIDGHGDYIRNLPLIMKAVGIRTKDELQTGPSPSSSYSGTQSNGQTQNEAMNQSTCEEGIDVVNQSENTSDNQSRDSSENQSVQETQTDHSASEDSNCDSRIETNKNSPDSTERASETNNPAKNGDPSSSGNRDVPSNESSSKSSIPVVVGVLGDIAKENCNVNSSLVKPNSEDNKGENTIENPSSLTNSQVSSVPDNYDGQKGSESTNITEAGNVVGHGNEADASRKSRLGRGALKHMKDNIQGRVTDAVETVKTNVKTVRKDLKDAAKGQFHTRRPAEGGVSFRPGDEEVGIDRVEKLERRSVKPGTESGTTDSDSEGCYFTDSNPNSEDEEEGDETSARPPSQTNLPAES